jgi:hypothetical protein
MISDVEYEIINHNQRKELFPAVHYIFFFLKEKEKGCRFHLG